MSDTYLRFLLELLTVVPASVIAFLPVRKKLRWSASRLWTVVIILELPYLLGTSWFCMRYRFPTASALLVTLLLFFPLYLWAVDLPWEKLLFCFSIAVMLCIFCSMYTNYLMAPVESDAMLTFSPSSSVVCLALIALVGLLFWRPLAVHLPYLLSLRGLDRFWAWLSLVPILLSIMFRWLVPPDLSTLLTGRTRTVALVLLPLFPLVLVLLFSMFWRVSHSLSESSRLTQENNLLQMEAKRFDSLRLFMDEARVLRHDFRQHLRVIGELAAAGENTRLLAYVQELEDLPKALPGQYCTNRSVDALCAWYTHRATEESAAFAWVLELPETLPMPDSEFCAMLGNLLDNALRAVCALPEAERKITVISRMLSDKMLGLSVENPYQGKLRLGPDGLPIRRGRDHGMGLTSVAATVSRHHGSLAVRTEDGVFSVDILLYF